MYPNCRLSNIFFMKSSFCNGINFFVVFLANNNSSKIASELIQCIGESGEYLGVAAFSDADSGTLIKPQVII